MADEEVESMEWAMQHFVYIQEAEMSGKREYRILEYSAKWLVCQIHILFPVFSCTNVTIEGRLFIL